MDDKVALLIVLLIYLIDEGYSVITFHDILQTLSDYKQKGNN